MELAPVRSVLHQSLESVSVHVTHPQQQYFLASIFIRLCEGSQDSGRPPCRSCTVDLHRLKAWKECLTDVEIACRPSLVQVVCCDLPDEVLYHPLVAQAAGFVGKSVEVSMRIDD